MSAEDERAERAFLQGVRRDGDVRDVVRAALKANGLQPIYTSPEGLRIEARVQDGKIVEWVGTGPGGQRRPVTVRRFTVGGKQQTGTIELRCWACIEKDGERLVCVEIPCR